MRALSIRQPWAELILRGVKTVEYRSRPTHVVGQRFWIYAARGPAVPKGGRRVWSRDVAAVGAGGGPPAWLWEVAERLILDGGPLPTGVIVGSAVVDRVTPGAGGGFEWHLAGVERAGRLRKPKGHPQPVWFEPF